MKNCLENNEHINKHIYFNYDYILKQKFYRKKGIQGRHDKSGQKEFLFHTLKIKVLA